MRQSNHTMKWIIGILCAVIITVWAIIPAGNVAMAQDAKTALFQEADESKQQAENMNAAVFSPTHFESAVKNYNQAEEYYKKGKKLDDIRKRLKMASDYFLKAVETTKLVQTGLSDCISARNDALAAEAPEFRKEEWAKAERAFFQAAKTVEKGNINSAQDKAKKAEEMYRTVELESIKANYLDGTKTLLEQAEKKNVKKYAPYTLDQAMKLVNRAEKLLSENRYDTDEARQIAQEARYEAKHAIYITKKINEMKKANKTLETVLLENEKPLQKIGDELDFNARFDEGFEAPASSIVQKIQKMQKEVATLNQNLTDKKEQVTALSDQVSIMEAQLGDMKSKEEALTKVMEQQRIEREKFVKVEKTFTEAEAQILRVGDKTIIRLYGLTFPVGKSTIEPQYFGLLSKVLKAIDVYPERGITVEGYTDSWGSDNTNQKLSTERAEAVQKYLLATGGIDAQRVNAAGFGETKPVASNETKEGRRKNRRIDVVIFKN